MPIARIITSMPELSGGLVRDLNSRGFEVHILSPEQTISGDADLEIRLDVAGSQQTMAEVFANNSLVMQAESSAPEEDIWTMLAAYDGDAEKIEKTDLQEELVPAVFEQSAVQEPLAEQVIDQSVAQNAEQTVPSDEENLAAAAIVREDTAAVETLAAENVVAASVIEHVSSESVLHKEAGYDIDPELVPSMFNFAGSAFESDAPVKEAVPTAENASTEEKHSIDGNDFRDLVAKKNGSWSFRAPRPVAAVGWVAVAFLLLASFMHRHNAIPPEANAGQVPFQPTASTATVVPVKAVIMTNTGVPVKTGRRTAEQTADIAADTIVHYGSKAKAAPLTTEKHSGVKYYTDQD